ncbi:hypothetical protein [Mycolicibacterium llatzerense]|uniref:hypothetical protein n=1 Tax=Mycolicibacterium llatzerense TaxID=280871 RepID=UPI0013A70262|nr:hypothetical protein [Mycolicibacterium llatzerense]
MTEPTDAPTVDVLRTIQVGTTAAEAAIAAVEDYGADAGTLLVRLGVLQILHVQMEDLRPRDDEEVRLLGAYRNWVDVALDYMGPAPTTTAHDYLTASGALSVEVLLASGADVPRGGRGSVPLASVSQQ